MTMDYWDCRAAARVMGGAMEHRQAAEFDTEHLRARLAHVLDHQTIDTEIGTILMPGPTYRGMWARDTAIAALGLTRLGKIDLARDLLCRYWSFQITPDSDPRNFVFRNKRTADWTDADAFRPTPETLLAEAGGFPTSVYIKTSDFPAGTCEIYADRADIDGVAWLIMALHDLHLHGGDEDVLHDLAPRVTTAVDYLRARDVDGDHLLEQGPNQDWADILLRHGKVSYTQAVWFGCLEAAEGIFAVVGDQDRARFCRQEREAVRLAVNRILMTPHGYYANYVAGDVTCLRRSLDTALLAAFGVCKQKQGRRLLTILETLGGPFGYAVLEPGYAPEVIGPSKYRPGQYQNEGIWPWITCFLALAWSRVGDDWRARKIIASLFENDGQTTHEWIDSLTGDHHHANFATAAGAAAWVIGEISVTKPL